MHCDPERVDADLCRSTRRAIPVPFTVKRYSNTPHAATLRRKELDMSIRRDKRFGTWFYRKWVAHPDGRKVRIFGTPKS